MESKEAAKKFREHWLLSTDSEVGGYQKYRISQSREGDVRGVSASTAFKALPDVRHATRLKTISLFHVLYTVSFDGLFYFCVDDGVEFGFVLIDGVFLMFCPQRTPRRAQKLHGAFLYGF